MIRVLYSIPVFALLVCWLFPVAHVLRAGFLDPSKLLLLFPMAVFVGGAGYIHRQRAKRGQDFVASLAACLVLASPLLAATALALTVAAFGGRWPAPHAQPNPCGHYVPEPPPVVFAPALADEPEPEQGAVERPIDQNTALVADEAIPESGWLGIEIETLDRSDPRAVGAAKRGGVLVHAVQDDRPAQLAGFQEQDIVVGIDGERMLDVNELIAKIRSTKPGTEIDIKIVRDNFVDRLDATVGSKYGPNGCAPWPCYVEFQLDTVEPSEAVLVFD